MPEVLQAEVSGGPWLEAWWSNEFTAGAVKSFGSELAVNSRRVLCTRRFFTEVLANAVSMKLGGLLLRV